MKRVVADTNVLVSAIQFGGKPKQLLELAADGHVDLALSEAILDETLRVLREKFHRTPEELRESDKQLRVIGRIVTPTERINAIDCTVAVIDPCWTRWRHTYYPITATASAELESSWPDHDAGDLNVGVHSGALTSHSRTWD